MQKRPIAQNTTYLTGALVIQKVIAFFFFLYIARTLGDASTGDYVAAFAFSSFFSVFVDIGLSQVLIREIARAPQSAQLLLRNTVGLKLVLGVAVYAVLLTTILLLEYFGLSHPPLYLVAVVGVIMLADSFVLTASSIFRGWQSLREESVVIVINKVGVLCCGLVTLWWWPSAVNVAIAVLIGSIASYLLLYFFLNKRIRQPLLPSFDAATTKHLLRLAAPFALAGFFATAYAQLDSILLSIMQGAEAVGLYSVASKTMNAFIFIPAAFMAAVYPAMSSFYKVDQGKLLETLHQSLRYLLIISVPLAIGLFLLADEFVGQIGPDYLASGTAVRILMPSMVFMFLSFPLGALLNATNRQHWQTGLIGIGLFVNIVLNILLIPKYSYVGSSIAWFSTNILVFILGLMLVLQITKLYNAALMLSVLRVLAAGIIMGVAVEHFITIPLWLVVPFGALLYSTLLVITQEVTKKDMRTILRVLRIKN